MRVMDAHRRLTVRAGGEWERLAATSRRQGHRHRHLGLPTTPGRFIEATGAWPNGSKITPAFAPTAPAAGGYLGPCLAAAWLVGPDATLPSQTVCTTRSLSRSSMTPSSAAGLGKPMRVDQAWEGSSWERARGILRMKPTQALSRPRTARPRACNRRRRHRHEQRVRLVSRGPRSGG